MTDEEFKWANELHWQVKGHLIPVEWCNDHNQVKRMMDGYFKRLWGNHEAPIHLKGFDQAWEQRYGQQQNKRFD